MKKYEFHRCEEDPFAIACSDCGIMYDEWWEPISEEELHKMHEAALFVDAHTPQAEKDGWEQYTGEPWEGTPENFDEFIEQQIEIENIREAV